MATILMAAVLVIILAGLFIAVFAISQQRFSKEFRNETFRSLNSIESLIKQHDPSRLRDGIVKLDTLLSKVMQEYYKNSESCGNNLKKAKRMFSSGTYNDIWTYHKLRNQIVHDSIDVNQKTASAAYKTFKKAILTFLNS